MKLRKALELGSIITILCILVLAGVMFFINQKITQSLENAESTNEVITEVFDLNVLTNEYLAFPDEGIKSQWLSTYNRVGRSLLEIEASRVYQGNYLEQKKLMNYVRTDFAKLHGSFVEIFEFYQAEERQRIPESKIASILFQSQTIIANASLLLQEDWVIVAFWQRQLLIVLLFWLFVLFVSLIVNLRVSRSLFSDPISELTLAVKSLQQGNLDFQINEEVLAKKNEISQLAQTLIDVQNVLGKTPKKLKTKLETKNKNLKETESTLQKKVEELEKLTVFLTGREVKMKELKTEVKKLKKQLNQSK